MCAELFFCTSFSPVRNLIYFYTCFSTTVHFKSFNYLCRFLLLLLYELKKGAHFIICNFIHEYVSNRIALHINTLMWHKHILFLSSDSFFCKTCFSQYIKVGGYLIFGKILIQIHSYNIDLINFYLHKNSISYGEASVWAAAGGSSLMNSKRVSQMFGFYRVIFRF